MRALCFLERPHCLNCGSASLKTIWESSFSDPFVLDNLSRDSYAGHPETSIGEQPIHRVECEQCGLAFHRYRLDDAGLVTLYSEWINDEQIRRFEAQDGNTQRRGGRFETGRQNLKHALRIRHLVSGLEDDEPLLLDFGCGDGDFLQAAQVLGFRCYGVDFSTTRIDRSARRGLEIFPSLESLAVELGSRKLHAITLFQTLEHVAEPLPLLRSLRSLLCPFGVLLVEVPDCSGIGKPRTREEYHSVHPLEHLNHFTPETLRAIGATAGFASAQRIPAHVTTHRRDVIKAEISRYVPFKRTSNYFRRVDR